MLHKFTLYGTNIVLDINNGAVHVFDPVAFEVLDYIKDYSEREIIEILGGKYGTSQVYEAIEEIKQLKDNGLLFSEDIYINMDINGINNRKSVLKAMCLHVSHDCNMRCKYCFASKGDFGSGRKLMSSETGKKAIDFLIKNSGNRRNLEVDFFGGEPLMNFQTIKDIVSYARNKEKQHGKNIRFTVTTNALLLNEENIKYINENFVNIVMSLDGRESVNDRMRVRMDGSGTYRHILEKIKKVAELREQNNYYVRGTFTRENLDFSEDVLHLADEGFKQISIEPVVAPDGSGYEIREEDLPDIKKEYEKLAFEYVKRRKEGRGFNFFHFMIDLEHSPCIEKRFKGCGSGFEYIAVTPEGYIYPCHQFVGLEEFKMGNIYDGVLNHDIVDMFMNSNILNKNECKKCWAKFYCGGGCAANAYHFNNSIDRPYGIGCELERKRVECALWIKTQLL
ncbi:MAG: thioether cross-link-forming SCIFF peptide maturase [Firmicutes bacterium]|nr:thioether cross-link-forming SCIFF peptide maturase [Bacillota bacterium]